MKAAVLAAAAAAAISASLIVPGQSIGPARLGMTAEQIAAAVQPQHCRVVALYDLAGRAWQLMTNWGGACATAGGTQAGAPLLLAVHELGQPAGRKPGRTYSYPSGRTAAAVWYLYPGIAFRAVAAEEDPETMGVITCIAVHYPDRAPQLDETCGAGLQTAGR